MYTFKDFLKSFGKYEKNKKSGMHLLSVLLIAILFCLPMCAGGCQMQGEDPDIDSETIDTDGQPNDSLLSNASSDGKLITVGFSQLGAESDWRVANTESIKGSFTREQGFELMFDDAPCDDPFAYPANWFPFWKVFCVPAAF